MVLLGGRARLLTVQNRDVDLGPVLGLSDVDGDEFRIDKKRRI